MAYVLGFIGTGCAIVLLAFAVSDPVTALSALADFMQSWLSAPLWFMAGFTVLTWVYQLARAIVRFVVPSQR